MVNRIKPSEMYASVREYLQELQDSGVDGLPFENLEQCAPPAKRQETGKSDVTESRVSDSAPRTLAELQEKIGSCTRCSLYKTRTSLVFGAGNEKARLLFAGEAPGADEDRQGEPFVGEAGRILTRIIEAMGLKRSDVYICNLLKCRPPENRNPHKDEIEACAPVLLQQIRIIKPEVIVALGTFAAQTLLHTKEPISKLRGKFCDYSGIPLMPTFHPSFLLHHKNDKGLYWDVWNDMIQVLKKLKLPVPDKKRKE